ncbi:hypothetical protein DL96DRAFT_1748618 [Flagelloscypha sp. PMI_526]|nr:hypothetical protein DL96DRAFT_1748618 [Flagelloscypha sp. PMI_526]
MSSNSWTVEDDSWVRNEARKLLESKPEQHRCHKLFTHHQQKLEKARQSIKKRKITRKNQADALAARIQAVVPLVAPTQLNCTLNNTYLHDQIVFRKQFDNKIKAISHYINKDAMLALGFSTITNALVTIAIGIRAWYLRDLTEDIRRSSPSPVYVLVILVEAGAIMCFTQILNLTLNIIMAQNYVNGLTLAASVASVIGDTVASSYPALIVIVLSFRGSMLDGATNVVAGMSLGIEETVEPNMREERQLTTLRFEPGCSIESRDASKGSARDTCGEKKKSSCLEIR